MTFAAAKLPSSEQVLELWNHWGMLPNIRAHSQQVSLVAVTMCQWLNDQGYPLRKDVIKVGALLHDIAKTYCLDKPELHHNLEGQRILDEQGYPELGIIVASHVNLPDHNRLDEASIVFYADKRVVGNRIVSVDERYEYILKVYGQGKPYRIKAIQRDAKLTFKVEQEIFKLLPARKPSDLCAIA